MPTHHYSSTTSASVGELSTSRGPRILAHATRWQTMVRWLRLAAHPATLRRALFTAALVGCILIAINHGDAILRGDLNRTRIAQMLLTFAVPFIVSTVSSVATRRELGQG